MPEALVPVLMLGSLMLFLVLYGMLKGSQYWLQALVNAFAHPHGSFLKVIALKAAGALTSGVLWVVNQVEHALSTAATHSIAPVVRWMDGLAAWLYTNAIAAGDFATEVGQGFERLVAHTIPRAVSRAVAVPLHEVQIGIRDLRKVLDRLRVYARGIDRLAQRTITQTIPHAVARVEGVLGREIARERARARAAERALAHPTTGWIKAIWRRGWVLVGAGLMTAYLVKKFPHLFCRNVTKGAKALCGFPASLIDLLLGDALALFVISDVCDTMRAIEVLAEQAEPFLRELVAAEDDFFSWCGGDLPSAHDTPGYSGSWLASGL